MKYDCSCIRLRPQHLRCFDIAIDPPKLVLKVWTVSDATAMTIYLGFAESNTQKMDEKMASCPGGYRHDMAKETLYTTLYVDFDSGEQNRS